MFKVVVSLWWSMGVALSPCSVSSVRRVCALRSSTLSDDDIFGSGFSEERPPEKKKKLVEEPVSWQGGYAEHDYERSGDLRVEVPKEDEIHDILAERVRAKRARDFERADELKAVLLSEFQVLVNDRQRSWSFGSKVDGRHDYTRVGDLDAAVEEEKVHEILAERVLAKRARDFDRADELKEVLQRELGVRVNDRARSWSVGASARTPSWFGDGHDYRRAGDLDEPIDNLETINEILAERVTAKRARDFDRADELKEVLMRDLNVRVDDRTRTWSLGRLRRPAPTEHDYTRDENDETEDVDIAWVDSMLLDRLQAKIRREFDKADAVRAELREKGVRVDDGAKTWRAGVDATQRDPWEKPKFAYSRVTSLDEEANNNGNLYDVDEKKVTRLLEHRREARRRQFWQKADEHLDELLTMGVNVDDTSHTWCVVGTTYERKNSNDDDDDSDAALDIDVPEDILATVDNLMTERLRAKLLKDFDQADAIRKHLKDNYDVAVDDKKRVYWFTKAPLPSALQTLFNARPDDESEAQQEEESVVAASSE